jgi:hypothetical protein
MKEHEVEGKREKQFGPCKAKHGHEWDEEREKHLEPCKAMQEHEVGEGKR